MSYKQRRITFLAVAAIGAVVAAQHDSMPPGISHEEHMKQMNERGNAAMGFDQEKVTHHFRLTQMGGIIEVSVNRMAGEATRAQIRDHLKTISQEFAKGVFTSPLATHGEVPPGVPAMRERKARITYTYEETPDGARVIVDTKDRAAQTAVHDFLRYQIREHATGDPVSVQK